MCKDAQELSIDLFRNRWEILLELCTELCGEVTSILDGLLNPGHDIIDVCWRGEFNLLALSVDPCVVETTGSNDNIEDTQRRRGTFHSLWPSGHRATC